MRVKKLEDFIGQEDLKVRLKVLIDSAKSKGRLEHILLSGLSGGGKTTLAYIIGDMLDWDIIEVNCAMVKTKSLECYSKIFYRHYENNTNPFILFLDEIHRLPMSECESLYRVMEERMVLGDPINFAIIGATNRVGMLPEPLVNRFGVVHYLDKYTQEELKAVVDISQKFLGCNGDSEAKEMIAKACRGTPRVAQNILREISNYQDAFSPEDVEKMFGVLGIDFNGLSKIDMRYMKAIESMGNKPTGLKTLEHLVDETAETIESKIEPFLLEMGLIERTAKGRILTGAGLKYIGSTIPSMSDMRKILGL